MKKYFLFLSIALFLFSCPQALALDEVLVSREGEASKKGTLTEYKKYKNNNILTSDSPESFYIDNFLIRNEKCEVGGALISKSASIDMIISDILRNSDVRSVEDYEKWLREKVEYKKDIGIDSWSSPEETIQRKYGDCEDYAFLNKAVLRVLGYESKVLAMGSVGMLMGRFMSSHAICVFEKDGAYLWFDDAKLKKTNAASMEEFAGYIFENYMTSSLSEINFDTREWKTLFTKSKE